MQQAAHGWRDPLTVCIAQPWIDPIVTAVITAAELFVAEGYHPEYFARNPSQPYCRAIVAPKVRKFRKHFLES